MTRREKEAYEWYLERLSMPICPIKLSKEECDAYNAEHPLSSEEEIQQMLKEVEL